MVFLGITPILIITTVLMVDMVKKYTIEEFKAYGKAGGIAQEVLGSMRTILSLGLHKKSVENYAENLKDAENMSKKKGLMAGIFGGVTTGLTDCCFAVAFYYGTYLARTDCENYSAENIIQGFFNMISVTISIGQAFSYLKELTEAKIAAKKIYDIIDTKSKVDVFDKKEGCKTLSEMKGSIDFENVLKLSTKSRTNDSKRP
jgi:ATP-binding cassette subfamily B (MDR/TAP) protein 1